VLVLVLAFMVNNLLNQLRDLSTAAGDNTRWSISRLDTELANLNATLSDRLGGVPLSDTDMKLRIDIAISRLNIVNSGRAREILQDNARAQELIASLNNFAAQAIALSDAQVPLVDDELIRLRTSLNDVRPHAREISLLGVNLGAEQASARRAGFAQQLSRTGGIAIVLLLMMVVFMIVLEHLLRRAAQRDAELLASSKQLASTVEASLDAIVIADEQGKIIDFNSAAEDVFGWSYADIIGRTMEDTIIPHRMRTAHRLGMKNHLSTGSARYSNAGRVELVALRRSGEEFPIELNLTSVADDTQTKFITYIRDISVRKISEQKLIDARDQAERTDRAKSKFLTVMSHEMRTPLNGILGVLDLLKTTKLDDKQERYRQIAAASSEILLEHINEALDITRIETGTLVLTPQTFHLPQFVQSLIGVLDPLAREKQLDLSLSIDASMHMSFYGDSNRIRQILTNLIGNAIKFTETGSIMIDVTGIHGPETSSVKFTVTDTGTGIAAEDQDQIFEELVMLSHGTGRQTRGDGLGLAISRRIARQMGGDIGLHSNLGQGSAFTLTVPLERRKADESGASAEETEQNRPSDPRNILVVEDNIINRNVLADMLVGMGHSVTEAENGVDCLEKTRQTKFDLIFMDISMPEMDGLEATRQLRLRGALNAQTHIIGLTAHGREEYRDATKAAGMNTFHTKPIRMDALHDIVGTARNAKSGALPATLPPSDVLGELKTALGPQKVHEFGQRFFTELCDFIEFAKSYGPENDPAELANAAHKLKGAASLLGQTTLEPILATFEEDAKAEDIPDLDQRIVQFEKRALDAHAAFLSGFPEQPC